MRRIVQTSVLCLVAGAVNACRPDEVVTQPDIPTAGVRFINAVPDSAGGSGMDFRFVDLVENNAGFSIGFRNNPVTSGGVPASTQIEYKNTKPGSRHFRIFLSDTLQSVASFIVKDSTFTVEAGHNYSVLLWGNARSAGADKMKLTILDETVADPTTNVALRVLNTTGAAIDVRYYLSTGTVPAAANWAGVAAYAPSAYIQTAPGNYRFNVQPAGGGAALFADATWLVGVAASSSAGATGKIDTDALPGTSVAGSAVTLIVFPRSVAGTKTPQTAAFQVPAPSLMWDRRPPRPPGA